MGAYFGGTIVYSITSSEAVLDALNFILSKEAPVVVGHSEGFGESNRVLPFAFKCKDENTLIDDGKGVSLEEFKKCFAGCNVTVGPLSPSVENSEQLKLARELEAACTMKCLRRSDIDPLPTAKASDPFSGLIGLKAQVTAVREAIDAAAMYGRDALCMNMVFTGGPGTGKSSFARAVGEYAASAGVLNGEVKAVSAEQLVAKYAGQTAHLVKEAWEKARGGVFFLDEAYRLSQTSSYGIEAINALNEYMEQDRGEVMVIVAGYEREMADFMESNPGLDGRFGLKIDFPDYTAGELFEIFSEGFVAGRGMKLEVEASDALKDACCVLKRSKGYANARSVRRLFERCLIKQAHLGGGNVITLKALSLALADEDLLVPERKIGFA